MAKKALFSVGTVGPITAGTLRTLQRKISEDGKRWEDEYPWLKDLKLHRTKLSPTYTQLSDWISSLIDRSDDPADHVSDIDDSRKHWAIYPEFDSLAGQYLRQICDAKDEDTAVSFVGALWQRNGAHDFQAFIRQNPGHPQSNQYILRLNAGDAMLAALHVMGEFAPVQVSHQKLTSEAKKVAAQRAELDASIEDFQSISASSKADMEQAVEDQNRTAERSGETTKRLIKGGLRRFKSQTDRWEDEFQATHKRYVDQLQYKAPVELWKGRAFWHRLRALLAISVFFAALAAFCYGLYQVVFVSGDALADKFTSEVCKTANGVETCGPGFSYLGPLTVSTIVLLSSLALWVLRIVYKLFLSENHLAMDASERMAFARTYYALVEDKAVTQDQEAIVLAALFKPTQDGMVKDDDSGMDLSTIALIANRMKP